LGGNDRPIHGINRLREVGVRKKWAGLSGAAKTLVVVLVLLSVGGAALGAYGIWYLFLQPPGPAAVASPAPIPSGAVSSLTTTDGTWNVDTTVGSFSDYSGTWVGYRVQEELASIGANIAVGRTPNVTGSLELQGTTLQSADVTADLTTLRSDDQRRDGQLVRQGIETGTFPTATFHLTQPLVLESVPSDGQTIAVTAVGDFTLHGVTRSVEIELTITRSGDVVGVTGSLEITFADYDVTPPSSFMVLSIDDHGTMELQIYFRHS
jgi:polyisoprenoid-binding protein YceI